MQTMKTFLSFVVSLCCMKSNTCVEHCFPINGWLLVYFSEWLIDLIWMLALIGIVCQHWMSTPPHKHEWCLQLSKRDIFWIVSSSVCHFFYSIYCWFFVVQLCFYQNQFNLLFLLRSMRWCLFAHFLCLWFFFIDINKNKRFYDLLLLFCCAVLNVHKIQFNLQFL